MFVLFKNDKVYKFLSFKIIKLINFNKTGYKTPSYQQIVDNFAQKC